MYIEASASTYISLEYKPFLRNQHPLESLLLKYIFPGIVISEV